MARERIVAILYKHREEEQIDVDLPLNITANEAVIGLNRGFHLGMDTRDLSKCCLKTEHPTALLRGSRTLEEFGLRDGTVIHYFADETDQPRTEVQAGENGQNGNQI